MSVGGLYRVVFLITFPRRSKGKYREADLENVYIGLEGTFHCKCCVI